MMNIVADSDNFTRGGGIDAPRWRGEGAPRERGRRRLVKIRASGVPLDEVGVRAAARLRGSVYVEKLGWLDPEDLSATGAESDVFDGRSTQFGVLEYGSTGATHALATVRLIERAEDPLPVHDLFPELRQTTLQAHEVSRYIANSSQDSLALRAVIVAHLLERDVAGVAVISRALQWLLGQQGLVVEEIGAPRVVPIYGSKPQVAVAIDAEASARQPKMERIVQLALGHDWDGVYLAAGEMTKEASNER